VFSFLGPTYSTEYRQIHARIRETSEPISNTSDGKGISCRGASLPRGRDASSDLGSRLRLGLARKIRRFSRPHASRELMLLAMRRSGVKIQRKYVGESQRDGLFDFRPADPITILSRCYGVNEKTEEKDTGTSSTYVRSV